MAPRHPERTRAPRPRCSASRNGREDTCSSWPSRTRSAPLSTTRPATRRHHGWSRTAGGPASLHRAVQEIDGEGGHDPAEVVLDRDPVVGTTALPYPGAKGRTREDGIDHEIPGGHHEGAEEGQTDEVAAPPRRSDRPSIHDEVREDVTRVNHHEPGEWDEDRDRTEPRTEGRGVVVRAVDQPRDDAGLLEDPGRDRCDREEGQAQPHAQRA